MSLLPPSLLPFWVDAPPGSGGGRLTVVPFAGIGVLAAFYASLYGPGDAAGLGWYARLNKPDWAGWIEWAGPATSLAIAVLITAAWRVWRLGAFRSVPATLLGSCAVLGLQSTWSTLFFALQSPYLGLLNLLLLCPASIILALLYGAFDRTAARLASVFCLWPLLLLSGNLAIWWRNG